MTLEARLTSLTSADAAPTLDDVGGEQRLLAELDVLPEHLVGRAAEILWTSWEAISGRSAALQVVLRRAPEVAGDFEFGEICAAAVAAAWSEGPSSIDATSDALLAVLTDDHVWARPIRAGYAIRQLALLAAQDKTPVRARVLTRIADLDDVPSSAASSFVRAYGQLNDIAESPWLDDKITALAAHGEAAPQAAVELALGDLRRAFTSDTEHDALQRLRSAATKFRSAAAADEDRDDAIALQAAAECVLAFSDRDAEQMEAWAVVAERSGRTLAMGRWRHDASAVENKVGGWVKLLAELRDLRAGLDSASTLHIAPAVRAIARAYGGLRLIEIEDERFGLRAVVVPHAVRALAESENKRLAMEELANEAGDPLTAYHASGLLDEAGLHPKARAARRRRNTLCMLGGPAEFRLIPSVTS